MSGHAATIHADMRAAFREKLLTLTDLPEMAWEGREYSDQIGTPFIREQFRPVYSRISAVGYGSTLEHKMTGNLTLFYPAKKGTIAIDAMAGALFALFLPGQSLVHGESSGTISNTERSALDQEPNWLSCTVTVTITAFTAN
jgi:hypothetical protein